jgi:hypothetical protein
MCLLCSRSGGSAGNDDLDFTLLVAAMQQRSNAE